MKICIEGAFLFVILKKKSILIWENSSYFIYSFYLPMKSPAKIHPISKISKSMAILFRDFIRDPVSPADGEALMLSNPHSLTGTIQFTEVYAYHSEDIFNNPKITIDKVFENLGPEFSLLNYSQEIIKDVLQDKDILIHYNRYYEDYKNLLVILGYFLDLQIKNQLGLFKKECEEHQKKNPNSSFLDFVESAKVMFKQENVIEVDATFLRILLMSYLLQILIEKVYINYYQLQHEVVVEKIIWNGLFLDILAERYLGFIYQDPVSEFSSNLPIESRRTLQKKHPLQFGREIDDLFVPSNFKRLFVIRLRRFYLNLVDFEPKFEIPWVKIKFEPIVSRIISYAGMVFFIPRLFINISYLVYHTYLYDDRHFFMSNQIQHVSLTKKERFQAQFECRWDLVIRDFLWLVNAIMGVMVFYGQLAIWSFLLNALLQCGEALLNLYLLKEYNAHLSSMQDWILGLNIPNNHENIRTSEGGLNIRWQTELEVLMSRLWNSVFVCLSSIMIIPVFAKISLVIPVCGAFLSIAMSCWQSTLGQAALEKRRLLPDPLVMKLSNSNTLNIQPSCISLAQP
jgi:hypothetical protein